MNFNTLVAEFSERNDIQLSSQNHADDGAVEAVFDDGKTRLKIAPHTRDEIRLESEITTIDPESDDGKRSITALLKGNLAQLKHQTGTLTLSPDQRSVLLFERIKLPELDIHKLTESVESFLDRVETFRRGLSAVV